MNHHISIKRRSGKYLQSFVKHGGRSIKGDRECKSSQFPKKNFGVFSKKPGKLILKSKKITRTLAKEVSVLKNKIIANIHFQVH